MHRSDAGRKALAILMSIVLVVGLCPGLAVADTGSKLTGASGSTIQGSEDALEPQVSLQEDVPPNAIAKVGSEYCDSMSDAIAKASLDNPITLLKDVETSNIIYISKDVKIVGDGNTITSSSQWPVYIYNKSGADAVKKVVFDNVNMKSTKSGTYGIDVNAACEVEINNCTLKCTGGGNATPILLAADATLNVSKSTLDAGPAGYGIWAYNRNGANINLTESSLKGFAAIQLQGSKNTQIVADKTTLEGASKYYGKSNNFATVNFYNAKGSSITLTGCTLKASALNLEEGKLPAPYELFYIWGGESDRKVTITMDAATTLALEGDQAFPVSTALGYEDASKRLGAYLYPDVTRYVDITCGSQEQVDILSGTDGKRYILTEGTNGTTSDNPTHGGLRFERQSDGTYKLAATLYAADSDGVKYATLADAVKASAGDAIAGKTPATIRLDANNSESIALGAGQSVIIEEAGFNYKVPTAATDCTLLQTGDGTKTYTSKGDLSKATVTVNLPTNLVYSTEPNAVFDTIKEAATVTFSGEMLDKALYRLEVYKDGETTKVEDTTKLGAGSYTVKAVAANTDAFTGETPNSTSFIVGKADNPWSLNTTNRIVKKESELAIEVANAEGTVTAEWDSNSAGSGTIKVEQSASDSASAVVRVAPTSAGTLIVTANGGSNYNPVSAPIDVSLQEELAEVTDARTNVVADVSELDDPQGGTITSVALDVDEVKPDAPEANPIATAAYQQYQQRNPAHIQLFDVELIATVHDTTTNATTEKELEEGFGKLTLRFPVDPHKNLNGHVARITHVHGDGSVVARKTTIVRDNAIEITVDKLSQFVVAVDAQASYTVKFDSKGGSSVADQSVSAHGVASRPSNPAREGYTFVEWRLAGESSAYDFSTPVTEDIVLTAVWKANPTPVVKEENKSKAAEPATSKVTSTNTTADNGKKNTKVKKVAMYRLYNPFTGEHFFTSSKKERNSLVRAEWVFEGTAWKAPATGAPVYRMYNVNTGEHFYTRSKVERSKLKKVDWKYEGIGWRSAGKGGVKVYRLYNPNAREASHHYTTSKKERNSLKKSGWKYEGVGWYGA